MFTLVRAEVPEGEKTVVIAPVPELVTVIDLVAPVVAVVSPNVMLRASVPPAAVKELIVTDSTPGAETLLEVAPVVVVARPTLTVKLSAVPAYVAAVVIAVEVALAAAPAAATTTVPPTFKLTAPPVLKPPNVPAPAVV
jgi:hypothetical protein